MFKPNRAPARRSFDLFQTRPARPSPAPDVAALERAVQQHGMWVPALREQVARVVVGQTALVDRLLVALLTGGTFFWKACRGWRRRCR